MTKLIIVLLTALPFVGQGQTGPQTDPLETRIFPMSSQPSVESASQLSTAVSSIAGIRNISLNWTDHTLTVRATPEQVGLAAWLISQLETAPAGAAHRHSTSPIYDAAQDREGKVRVLWFEHAESVQQFQEMATLIRSTAEIALMFTLHGPRAAVTRGSADKLAYAEWLFNQLDAGSSTQPPSMREYLVGGSPRDIARLYFVDQTQDVASFQQLATMVRGVSELRRVFTYNALRAISFRDAPEPLAVADWMMRELSHPPKGGAAADTHELVTTKGDTVRVFYLDNPDAAKVQDAVIRVERAFFYRPSKALAVRGSAAQVGQAEQLLAAH